MIEQLRQRLQALQRTAGIEGGASALPLGIAAIDQALGGGLARGALHEIAAPGKAHLAAATGFVLGLAALSSPSPRTKPIVIPGRREAASPESIITDREYGFLYLAICHRHSDGGRRLLVGFPVME